MEKPDLSGTFSNGAVWEFFVTNVVPVDHPTTAVVAYIVINNRIVLTKNHRGWDLPGGHVEKSETIEEALIREVYEEAGVVTKNFVLFGKTFVKNTHGKIREETGEPYPKLGYVLFYEIEPEEYTDTCTAPECEEHRLCDFDGEEVNSSGAKVMIDFYLNKKALL